MKADRKDYQKRYQQEYQERTKRVNLTFSQADYRSLSRAAKASGLPLAAYVKAQALMAHTGQAVIPEAVSEQLATLDRLIRTIANNVNQMARHSHQIGQVLDEQEVFLHIQSLERELRNTIAGIGKTDHGSGP